MKLIHLAAWHNRLQLNPALMDSPATEVRLLFMVLSTVVVVFFFFSYVGNKRIPSITDNLLVPWNPLEPNSIVIFTGLALVLHLSTTTLPPSLQWKIICAQWRHLVTASSTLSSPTWLYQRPSCRKLWNPPSVIWRRFTVPWIPWKSCCCFGLLDICFKLRREFWQKEEYFSWTFGTFTPWWISSFSQYPTSFGLWVLSTTTKVCERILFVIGTFLDQDGYTADNWAEAVMQKNCK